jgi:hypothetical protein
VQIPVVIGADLRAMADWLPPQAQRISDISCVGLALDGSSDLTRHSFAKIVERQPTLNDLSHPARYWDEQGVQSTNQPMEGLLINVLLVQLYQLEVLATGPAPRCQAGRASQPTGRATTVRRSPRGPAWIGKDYPARSHHGDFTGQRE